MHGQTGAEYRTENETYTKIIAKGAQGADISWFEVWLRDGRLQQYGNENGNTSNSNIKASGPNSANTKIWAINEVRDRHGNAMTYSYERNAAEGDFRISQISYLGGNFNVEFKYSDRTDTTRKYFSGSWSKVLKRLDEININDDSGFSLSSYHFEYETQVSGASPIRLTNIKRCMNSVCTAETALKETSLNWENISNWIGTFSSSNTMISQNSIDESDGQDGVLHFGDWDGDGLTDMMWFHSKEEFNRWYTNDHSRLSLESIARGTGLTTTFHYKPLTYTSVYLKDAEASYPIRDLVYPRYVVSSVDSLR